MTRYFYTDSVDAATMAKKFGMRFDIYCQSKGGIRIAKDVGAWRRLAMFGDDYRFYIHPESLPLLEPKERDIVINSDTERPAYIIDREHLEFHRDSRIIARDGKAFHWPEKEDTHD